MKAFSIMLSDNALQFYLDSVKGSSTNLDEAISKMRKRFITPERTLSLTREWDSTALLQYFSRYPEKPPKDVLEIMVARLQEL